MQNCNKLRLFYQNYSVLLNLRYLKLVVLCIIATTDSGLFSMNKEAENVYESYVRLQTTTAQTPTDLLNKMSACEIELSNCLGSPQSHSLCKKLKKTLEAYENFITTHMADVELLRKSHGFVLSEIEESAGKTIKDRMSLIKRRVAGTVITNLLECLRLKTIDIEKGLTDVSFVLKLGEGRNLLSALYEASLDENEQSPQLLLWIAKLKLVSDEEIFDSYGVLFSERSMLLGMLENLVLGKCFVMSDLSDIFSLAIEQASSGVAVSYSSLQASLLLLDSVIEIIKTKNSCLTDEAAQCAEIIKYYYAGDYFVQQIDTPDEENTSLKSEIKDVDDLLTEIKSNLERLRLDCDQTNNVKILQRLAFEETANIENSLAAMHADLEKITADLRVYAELPLQESISRPWLPECAEQCLESAESLQELLEYKKSLFNDALAFGDSVVAFEENAANHEKLCCTFLGRLHFLISRTAVEQEDVWIEVVTIINQALVDERESVRMAGNSLESALLKRIVAIS